MQQSCREQKNPSELWQKFALQDPYTYILTSLKNADADEFWQSGQRTVQEELLPLLVSRGICRDTGMELGCGVGRLLLPLGPHFREAVGVDIAEEMVLRARCFAREKGVHNVSYFPISGPEELLKVAGKYEGKVSFLYSLLVFQHIPDFAMIEGYLCAIRILLEVHGIAYLQFDTRPKGFAYQLKTKLPDFVLPRFWRKGIRRIRRSPDELEASMRKAGLEIIGELTPGTEYHRYILRRASTQASSA
jgi:SAM-dependent methyltransferase